MTLPIPHLNRFQSVRVVIAILVYLSLCILTAGSGEHEDMVIGEVGVETLVSPRCQGFAEVYRTSRIDFALARELGRWMHENSTTQFVVIFGSWCSDSRREVPRFLKIIELSGVALNRVRWFGVDRLKQCPEQVADRFSVKRVATFLLLKDGVEVGRITETPERSLESDLQSIIRRVGDSPRTDKQSAPSELMRQSLGVNLGGQTQLSITSPIDHVFEVSSGVYSGAEPSNEEHFRWLSERGIKTLISVDGTAPQVEAASRHKLRYVHIPFGYGSISDDVKARLLSAYDQLPKPIFLHCHHGKHRGPAAVAIIGKGRMDWSQSIATEWMARAGTSRDYSGLFQSVSTTKPGDFAEFSSRPQIFPEMIPPQSMTQTMVEIDEAWSRFKKLHSQLKKQQQPDSEKLVDLASDATLIKEHFVELSRQSPPDDLAIDRRRRFEGLLRSGENQAAGIVHILRSFLKHQNLLLPSVAVRTKARFQSKMERFIQSSEQNCRTCHKSFRD